MEAAAFNPGASDASARRRFGPIHHQARPASSADQPDSISHVRDIVPWRDVGTIETPLASRANRVGPAGESGADAFDFIGLEPFGHGNEISRACFGSAIFFELAKGPWLGSRGEVTLLTALA